jgi:hypothetical protein
LHHRKDLAELTKLATEVRDLVRSLPVAVASEYEKDLTIGLRGILRRALTLQMEKPRLNLEDVPEAFY